MVYQSGEEPPERPAATIHPVTPVQKEPDPVQQTGEPRGSDSGGETGPGSPKFSGAYDLLEEEVVIT